MPWSLEFLKGKKKYTKGFNKEAFYSSKEGHKSFTVSWCSQVSKTKEFSRWERESGRTVEQT